MQTQNLSTLKINKLTQAQYERELEAGRIDENALYLTPDDGTTGEIGGDTLPLESQFLWDKEGEIPTGYVEVTPPFSNPNLLINSNFRRPINQRGQKDYSFTGTKIYTIDRWWTTGNVTVSNTHLNFWGQNSYFVQTFGHVLVATKHIITVSVVSMYGTVTCNGVSLKQGLNYITFDATGSNYGTELVFYADGDASINIEFVKLEQGEIATPFVPRTYEEELALCQRYCDGRFYAADAVMGLGYIINGVVYLHTNMSFKSTPTVTYNTTAGITIYYNGTSTATIAPEAIGCSEFGVISFANTISGLANGSIVQVHSRKAGQLLFDAEIY